MSPTQILHAIYLSVIVGIVVLGAVAMTWWHHDAVVQGEEKCRAAVQKAAQEQYQADTRATKDALDGLAADKERLQLELDARPPAVVRKCPGSRVLYVDRPVPASGPSSAVQPAQPPHGSSDSSVPAGSGGGDVGPGVRAIAAAGELESLYYSRLYEWAMKTR